MTQPEKTPGPAPKELHRYVDGDLSPAEEASLRAAAELDPTIGPRIEGLLEVGELVRETAERASADLDADALFARIEADLASSSSAEMSASEVSSESFSAASARPALRVIQGGSQPAATETNRAGAADVKRRRTIGVVIGALAVAAAAAIAVSQWDVSAPEVATNDVRPSSGDLPETVASGDPARTEVLEVDFGTNVGSIFSVEDDSGERYVVVWLDDQGMANN